jgi:hypothetical protein
MKKLAEKINDIRARYHARFAKRFKLDERTYWLRSVSHSGALLIGFFVYQTIELVHAGAYSASMWLLMFAVYFIHDEVQEFQNQDFRYIAKTSIDTASKGIRLSRDALEVAGTSEDTIDTIDRFIDELEGADDGIDVYGTRKIFH